MIEIIKILHKTSDTLYLKFSNKSIKKLKRAAITRQLPNKQKKIIKKNWATVKIGEMGCLHFSSIVEIGGDTIFANSLEIIPAELLKIATIKRIAKKRIIESIANLF